MESDIAALAVALEGLEDSSLQAALREVEELTGEPFPTSNTPLCIHLAQYLVENCEENDWETLLEMLICGGESEILLPYERVRQEGLCRGLGEHELGLEEEEEARVVVFSMLVIEAEYRMSDPTLMPLPGVWGTVKGGEELVGMGFGGGEVGGGGVREKLWNVRTWGRGVHQQRKALCAELERRGFSLPLGASGGGPKHILWVLRSLIAGVGGKVMRKKEDGEVEGERSGGDGEEGVGVVEGEGLEGRLRELSVEIGKKKVGKKKVGKMRTKVKQEDSGNDDAKIRLLLTRMMRGADPTYSRVALVPPKEWKEVEKEGIGEGVIGGSEEGDGGEGKEEEDDEGDGRKAVDECREVVRRGELGVMLGAGASISMTWRPWKEEDDVDGDDVLAVVRRRGGVNPKISPNWPQLICRVVVAMAEAPFPVGLPPEDRVAVQLDRVLERLADESRDPVTEADILTSVGQKSRSRYKHVYRPALRAVMDQVEMVEGTPLATTLQRHLGNTPLLTLNYDELATAATGRTPISHVEFERERVLEDLFSPHSDVVRASRVRHVIHLHGSFRDSGTDRGFSLLKSEYLRATPSFIRSLLRILSGDFGASTPHSLLFVGCSGMPSLVRDAHFSGLWNALSCLQPLQRSCIPQHFVLSPKPDRKDHKQAVRAVFQRAGIRIRIIPCDSFADIPSTLAHLLEASHTLPTPPPQPDFDRVDSTTSTSSTTSLPTLLRCLSYGPADTSLPLRSTSAPISTLLDKGSAKGGGGRMGGGEDEVSDSSIDEETSIAALEPSVSVSRQSSSRSSSSSSSTSTTSTSSPSSSSTSSIARIVATREEAVKEESGGEGGEDWVEEEEEEEEEEVVTVKEKDAEERLGDGDKVVVVGEDEESDARERNVVELSRGGHATSSVVVEDDGEMEPTVDVAKDHAEDSLFDDIDESMEHDGWGDETARSVDRESDATSRKDTIATGDAELMHAKKHQGSRSSLTSSLFSSLSSLFGMSSMKSKKSVAREANQYERSSALEAQSEKFQPARKPVFKKHGARSSSLHDEDEEEEEEDDSGGGFGKFVPHGAASAAPTFFKKTEGPEESEDDDDVDEDRDEDGSDARSDHSMEESEEVQKLLLMMKLEEERRKSASAVQEEEKKVTREREKAKVEQSLKKEMLARKGGKGGAGKSTSFGSREWGGGGGGGRGSGEISLRAQARALDMRSREARELRVRYRVSSIDDLRDGGAGEAPISRELSGVKAKKQDKVEPSLASSKSSSKAFSSSITLPPARKKARGKKAMLKKDVAKKLVATGERLKKAKPQPKPVPRSGRVGVRKPGASSAGDAPPVMQQAVIPHYPSPPPPTHPFSQSVITPSIPPPPTPPHPKPAPAEIIKPSTIPPPPGRLLPNGAPDLKIQANRTWMKENGLTAREARKWRPTRRT